MPDLIGHLEPMKDRGYIYMMTNASNKTLYIGVTSSIKKRVSEHRDGIGSEFTRKYGCTKLVYYEIYSTITQAIEREKQLKHYQRAWKNELVEKMNPQWEDLGQGIIDDPLAM